MRDLPRQSKKSFKNFLNVIFFTNFGIYLYTNFRFAGAMIAWVLIVTILPGMYSCVSTHSLQESSGEAPAKLLGEFEDDYGIEYAISSKLWKMGQEYRYEIIHWFPDSRYLIAKNSDSNPSEPGLYSRIDWVDLGGMEPYTWAYCHSRYNAMSKNELHHAENLNTSNPLSGCNGFPFTRMKNRN